MVPCLWNTEVVSPNEVVDSSLVFAHENRIDRFTTDEKTVDIVSRQSNVRSEVVNFVVRYWLWTGPLLWSNGRFTE
jgi:hypothetical protein